MGGSENRTPQIRYITSTLLVYTKTSLSITQKAHAKACRCKQELSKEIKEDVHFGNKLETI